jgi:hypothetical protein
MTAQSKLPTSELAGVLLHSLGCDPVPHVP